MLLLTRHDIVAAVGAVSATAQTNDWANMTIEMEKLLGVWLPKGFRTGANRKLAEARLAASTVHRVYLLSELGVDNQQQLLENYFEKDSTISEIWWIRKKLPAGVGVREPDLVATLKANGFEVMQGELVPILFARPK